MSTTDATTEPVQSTRASIDVTEASAAEVRAFAASEGRSVHLERRGGRTFLVTAAPVRRN
jgi:hypothetical protein